MKQEFTLKGEQEVNNIVIKDFCDKWNNEIVIKGCNIKGYPVTLNLCARTDGGFHLSIYSEKGNANKTTQILCYDGKLKFKYDEHDTDGDSWYGDYAISKDTEIKRKRLSGYFDKEKSIEIPIFTYEKTQ